MELSYYCGPVARGPFKKWSKSRRITAVIRVLPWAYYRLAPPGPPDFPGNLAVRPGGQGRTTITPFLSGGRALHTDKGVGGGCEQGRARGQGDVRRTQKCCVGHCMHAGALHTCCTPRGVRRASRFLGSLYSRPTLCVPVHVAIRCITPTITGHTHARTHARLHACADTFGVPNNVHHAYVSAVAPQLLQRREREHVKGPQVAALPGILHGCRCHPQAWCLAAADARLSSSRGRHCRRGDHAHAAGGTVRLRTSHALVADGAQHNPRHRIRRDARSDAQGAAHAIEANVAAVASGLPLMHQCQRHPLVQYNSCCNSHF